MPLNKLTMNKTLLTDWKTTPFTDGVSIPLELTLSHAQFAQVTAGLLPKRMEDKWFIYFDAPALYLHRSWTGRPVFKITFAEDENTMKVSEALLASDLVTGKAEECDYQARLAFFLIHNLLLGQTLPFPKPPGMEESVPGFLQHHISGSGYPEK